MKDRPLHKSSPARPGSLSRRTSAVGPIRTRRQLADALGIDQRSLRRLVSRPDWPVGDAGPWGAGDIETVQAWRRDFRRPDPKLADSADDGRDLRGEIRALMAWTNWNAAYAESLHVAHERLRRRMVHLLPAAVRAWWNANGGRPVAESELPTLAAMVPHIEAVIAAALQADDESADAFAHEHPEPEYPGERRPIDIGPEDLPEFVGLDAEVAE